VGRGPEAPGVPELCAAWRGPEAAGGELGVDVEPSPAEPADAAEPPADGSRRARWRGVADGRLG
jgi:hypothetical protein